jgi:hypothetical protein
MPLEAMANYTVCPDLFSFDTWTGADGTGSVTEVTINGATSVTADYIKTSPGCSMVWSGDMVEIFNADFEEPAEGYVIPFWSKGAAPAGTWVQVPPDPSTGENLDFTSSGNQMIYVGSGGQLHQVPGEIIEADTLYSVEIDMASRSDVDPELAWAYVGLFAKDDTAADLSGTQLVMQGFGDVVGELLNPNADQWYTKTVSWDSTGSSYVGKYLQIYINADRVTMDNVRIRKSTQGVPANISIVSNPDIFADPGGRPAIYPTKGSYQIAFGAQLDVSANGFVSCPNTYVTDSIASDYGNFSGNDGSLLIDTDGTVTVNYITNNVCGDACNPQPEMDFTDDCYVDLADFAEFISYWLEGQKL